MEWRHIESAPDCVGDSFLAGLWVKNKGGKRWFEYYCVSVDGYGEYVDREYGDPLSWGKIDFTHWMAITPP
jgi:hypothetical protein